jgi:hypothetical protein
MNAAPTTANTLTLYSGRRLDLAAPHPRAITLGDVAECLARTDGAFARAGFYSLAQRGVILAQGIGYAEGPLAACYALLSDAGTAILRGASPFSPVFNVNGGLYQTYEQLMAALHGALDLDWPIPVGIGAPLRAIRARLELRELLVFGQDCAAEIASLSARGVVALPVHLTLMPREKAWLKWCGTWKVMAAAAGLPRTDAWRGI